MVDTQGAPNSSPNIGAGSVGPEAGRPVPPTHDPLEEWLSRHPRQYATGEEVRVGDMVDFGFDGKFINGPSIDLSGGPWAGQIVRLDRLHAIVDTYLNSFQRHPIADLRFLERGALPPREEA